MITLDQIQAFSQQIAEKFQPDRIILFGSYAYGYGPHRRANSAAIRYG
jgi:hypothetical protein